MALTKAEAEELELLELEVEVADLESQQTSDFETMALGSPLGASLEAVPDIGGGGGLPVGAIAGGALGALAGAPGGPVGAIAGAGLGAAGGEAIEQNIRQGLKVLGFDVTAPETSLEAARKIGVEGLLGLAGEGVGRGLVSGVARLRSGKPTINSLVKTALKLPKKKGIERIDTLAQEFLDRGLNVTRKSLKSLDDDMLKVRNAINGIVDKSTAEGVTIKTDDIVSAIDDLVANAGKQGLESPDLKVIQRMRDSFVEQNGTILTPREVQDLKVGFNKAFKADLESRFGQVRGKIRDKLREASKLQLEEIHPELKELNANESVMIDLSKAIEDRIIAIEKEPIIPVRGLIAGSVAGTAVGAGSGNVGAGLAFGATAIAADKIITSPRLQISVAKAINKATLKLAKEGNLSKIIRPALQVQQGLSEQVEPTQ